MTYERAEVLFETDAHRGQYGVVRLEKWPDGLVLWVGGEARWRSSDLLMAEQLRSLADAIKAGYPLDKEKLSMTMRQAAALIDRRGN